MANLDVFNGSSGTGVFVAESMELAGIITEGDNDWVLDESRACFRVKRYLKVSEALHQW